MGLLNGPLNLTMFKNKYKLLLEEKTKETEYLKKQVDSLLDKVLLLSGSQREYALAKANMKPCEPISYLDEFTGHIKRMEATGPEEQKQKEEALKEVEELNKELFGIMGH